MLTQGEHVAVSEQCHHDGPSRARARRWFPDFPFLSLAGILLTSRPPSLLPPWFWPHLFLPECERLAEPLLRLLTAVSLC